MHASPSSALDNHHSSTGLLHCTHDNMVTACLLDHVCDQLGSDGRSTFVFFILPSIRKKRYHCCYPFCACNFACVNHNAKLHKWRIDSTAASRDNVHIVFANGLRNSYICFANAAAGNFSLGKRQANSMIMDVNDFQRMALEGYRRAIISASSGWLVPICAIRPSYSWRTDNTPTWEYFDSSAV